MSSNRRNFIHRNEAFVCKQCGKTATPLLGGCRNHCPYCLYSLHVDRDIPGDRKSACRGLMKPLRLEPGSRKGHLGHDIVHECTRCGKQIKNLLSEDDRWETMPRPL